MTKMDGVADHFLQKNWKVNYSVVEITTLGSKHSIVDRMLKVCGTVLPLYKML